MKRRATCRKTQKYTSPGPGAREHEAPRALARETVARLREVASHPAPRLATEWDEALLATLAQDAHDPELQVEAIERQPRELRGAQARRVQHLEHRSVAKAQGGVGVGRFQQGFDLGGVGGGGR